MLPAYILPLHATYIAVLRCVIRKGFSRDMAKTLFNGIIYVIKNLEKEPPGANKALNPVRHQVC